MKFITLNPREHIVIPQSGNLFYQREQNLTQFVIVLLVKLSDMLHSSNFVRLFHHQSFTVYWILCWKHSFMFERIQIYYKEGVWFTQPKWLFADVIKPRMLVVFSERHKISYPPNLYWRWLDSFKGSRLYTTLCGEHKKEIWQWWSHLLQWQEILLLLHSTEDYVIV